MSNLKIERFKYITRSLEMAKTPEDKCEIVELVALRLATFGKQWNSQKATNSVRSIVQHVGKVHMANIPTKTKKDKTVLELYYAAILEKYCTPEEEIEDLVMVTVALAEGTVNVAYSDFIVATGGVLPYVYSSAGPINTGLSLDADTGEISGIPTVVGEGPHKTYTVTDAEGTQVSTGNIPILINA